jgi:hypothetical protein
MGESAAVFMKSSLLWVVTQRIFKDCLTPEDETDTFSPDVDN